MKKITICAVLALTLSACGTVPESRQHFITLLKDHNGMGSSRKMIFSKEVTSPFNQAFGNIEQKLKSCIPEGHTQTTVRGTSMSSLTVKNNQRIERISPNKAEITVQQFHSSTYMQSKGGFYLLAADMIRQGDKSIRLDFYTGKHYLGIAKAIEEWANGSQKCHGIGGNA